MQSQYMDTIYCAIVRAADSKLPLAYQRTPHIGGHVIYIIIIIIRLNGWK